MSIFPEHEVEQLVEEKVVDTTQESSELIVFNDDVNTFDHVIETLINVCDHSVEQAEQCTWIIHYKGKCAVKLGAKKELLGMRKEIVNKGISAEVF